MPLLARKNCTCLCHSTNAIHIMACCDGIEPSFTAGRFVLLRADPHDEKGGWYCTSFDTWEEAEACFDDGRMPKGYRLLDEDTGRVWLPGARYEWEDAQT